MATATAQRAYRSLRHDIPAQSNEIFAKTKLIESYLLSEHFPSHNYRILDSAFSVCLSPRLYVLLLCMEHSPFPLGPVQLRGCDPCSFIRPCSQECPTLGLMLSDQPTGNFQEFCL